MIFKSAESTEEPEVVHPMKAAVEAAIIKKLDKDNRDEDGVLPETVVQREPTIVKQSAVDFWEKVAACVEHLRAAKKVKKIKK